VTVAPRDGLTDAAEQPLRVLVVDDHDVVHWGFRLMLGKQPWVQRCLGARSGEEAYALARRYEPHVALVDLFIAEESGADVCEQLRKRSPTTHVLLISGAGRISTRAAMAAGASGFVSKDWAAPDIARAVRMVGLGLTIFQPQAGAALPLSPREREVLELVARGLSNGEIAAALVIEESTVKTHVKRILMKLDLRNRVQAVIFAYETGLTSPG
jgi:DNA-binding NarL/FixJ family response regulator